jgi:DNA-binding NarL/FixJ family response regulator
MDGGLTAAVLVSPLLHLRMDDFLSNRWGPPHTTTREREVLQLVAEGKSNKEVANLLNLSLYTVETHRTHILQKLNLHSVPELILYAVRKGIIS